MTLTQQVLKLIQAVLGNAFVDFEFPTRSSFSVSFSMVADVNNHFGPTSTYFLFWWVWSALRVCEQAGLEIRGRCLSDFNREDSLFLGTQTGGYCALRCGVVGSPFARSSVSQASLSVKASYYRRPCIRR